MVSGRPIAAFFIQWVGNCLTTTAVTQSVTDRLNSGFDHFQGQGAFAALNAQNSVRGLNELRVAIVKMGFL